jgi:hypothetical protein
MSKKDKEEEKEEKEPKEPKKRKPPEVNVDLYELACKIITKYADRFGNLTRENIAVVSIFGKAKAKFLGKCRPVRSPYSALLGEDLCYIIEVNQDRLEMMGTYKDPNKKALKMLLYHEMAHIHEDGCDSEEKGFRKTIKHDVEDFSECLKLAGNKGPYDWFGKEDIPDILA